MAGLSLKNSPDIKAFIQAFSGTNLFIMDYLVEEVLDNQPEPEQAFLLQTSILKRLSDPLCRAVCSNLSMPLEGGMPNQDILEYLDRSNLFLIPLDEERNWYSYHPLFASLLRSRLQRSTIYGVKTLHLRAADWLEKNGFPEDAIYHALEAKDFSLAAQLIEDQAEAVWLRAEYSRLIEWIKALPIDLVKSHPWLSVWNAWSVNQIGLLDEASTWIEAADQAVHKTYLNHTEASTPPPDMCTLEDEIAALHTHLACLAQGARWASQVFSDDLEEQELLFLTRAKVQAALFANEFKVMPWAMAISLALLRFKTWRMGNIKDYKELFEGSVSLSPGLPRSFLPELPEILRTHKVIS